MLVRIKVKRVDVGGVGRGWEGVALLDATVWVMYSFSLQDWQAP